MTHFLEVDLTPLRVAFLDSGQSAAQVAERLGWVTAKGFADGERLRIQLGLKRSYYAKTQRRQKFSCLRQTTSYERATELARAIGVDPVEVGL